VVISIWGMVTQTVCPEPANGKSVTFSSAEMLRQLRLLLPANTIRAKLISAKPIQAKPSQVEPSLSRRRRRAERKTSSNFSARCAFVSFF